MGIYKEIASEVYQGVKEHKVRTFGGAVFMGTLILGVVDHNCNPQEESFVKENESNSENIENNDSGMVPLENGFTAEIVA